MKMMMGQNDQNKKERRPHMQVRIAMRKNSLPLKTSETKE